jgi:hypothetical protein
MWLHHDASWWALVLAILALLLMLPVNLLANFITPGLKNWWAQRSTSGLTDRIVRLRGNLAESMVTPLLTDTENELFMGLESIAYLIWNVGYLLLGCLGVLVTLLPEIVKGRRGFTWVITVAMLVISYLHLTTNRRMRIYRRERSQKYRQSLTSGIAELEGRLNDKASSG